MKTPQLALLVWLAATLSAVAQPNSGPPSITSQYGANPSTGAQMFQKPTQPGGAASGGNTSNLPLHTAYGAPVGAYGAVSGAIPAADASGAGNVSANLTSIPVIGGNAAAPVAAANATTAPAPVSTASGPDVSAITLPSTMDSIDDTHPLAPRDLFVYQVTEDGDKPKILLVDEDGNVDVPYYGRVHVAGMTLRAMAKAISDILIQKNKDGEQLYKRATVLVAPYSGLSRGQYNVVGAVNHQGTYDIPPQTVVTLWHAILNAGDFAAGADRKNVTLVHHHPDDPTKDKREIINFDDLMARDQLDSKIVQPNDIIIVPSQTDTSGFVTILGNANSLSHPGRMALPAGTQKTVLDAYLQAGPTDWAYPKVTLKSHDAKGQETTQIVDMDLVINKGETNKDVVLKPGDVIIVDQKNFLIGG